MNGPVPSGDAGSGARDGAGIVEDGSRIVSKAEGCSEYDRAELNVVGIIDIGGGAVAGDAVRASVHGSARAIDGLATGKRACQTIDRAGRRLAHHREWSDRQRQPQHLQAMTCKWAPRQTVRDFPLHSIPQSHSDAIAAPRFVLRRIYCNDAGNSRRRSNGGDGCMMDATTQDCLWMLQICGT